MTPAALSEPELPAKVRASEIVGRWGYAAYHKPEDRARTEKNARGQCKQPFVIGQGPTGGVMMYLANSSELQELRLKGTGAGRDYIGPSGQTPGAQDREIISFDGRVMLLKFVEARHRQPLRHSRSPRAHSGSQPPGPALPSAQQKAFGWPRCAAC